MITDTSLIPLPSDFPSPATSLVPPPPWPPPPEPQDYWDPYDYVDILLAVTPLAPSLVHSFLSHLHPRVTTLTPGQVTATIGAIVTTTIDVSLLQHLIAAHVPHHSAALTAVVGFLQGGPPFHQAWLLGLPPGLPDAAPSPLLGAPGFVSQAVQAGLLTPCPRHRSSRHHPVPALKLFPVPKPHTTEVFRLILDCRALNRRLSPPPLLQLPSLRALLHGIDKVIVTAPTRDSVRFLTWDMSSWFYQFRTGGALRQHLQVRLQGQHFTFDRLPMGLSWAPSLAQQVHVMLIDTAISQCVPVHLRHTVFSASWIDNGLLVGPAALIQTVYAQFAANCAVIGATIKEVHGPTTDTTYVGVHLQVDGQHFQWQPAAASLQALQTCHSHMQGVPAQGKVTPRQLFQWGGLLFWICAVHLVPLCHFETVLGVLRQSGTLAHHSGQGWHTPIPVSTIPWAQLCKVFHTVTAQVPRWATIVSSDPPMAPPVHVMFTDASDTGWGITVTLATGAGVTAQGVWGSQQQVWGIFLKEAFVALVIGAHLRQNWPGSWCVGVDNMGCVGVMHRGMSSISMCNKWLSAMHHTQPPWSHCSPGPVILPIWVATSANPADELSRGLPFLPAKQAAALQSLGWRAGQLPGK